MVFLDSINIFIEAFTGTLDAIFSAIWGNIPSFYSIYSITKAFSIDHIICGLLGISVIFSFIVKIVKLIIEKSSKR